MKDSIEVDVSRLGNIRGNSKYTALAKNGKFQFKISLGQPVNLILHVPYSQQKGAKVLKASVLPGIPNATVELSGTIDSFNISGSDFYKRYAYLNRVFCGNTLAMGRIYAAFEHNLAQGMSREDATKDYVSKMDGLKQKTTSALLDYVRQHSNDEMCGLVAKRIDIDSFEVYKKIISPQVRNGAFKGEIDAVDEYLALLKQKEEAKSKIIPGNVAPDFTLNEITNKPFALHSLRGKYVVLDFWSWCGWCIKGMPQMKEYYNKYNGKFEIVGVDCNDTEAKWKAAVEKYQLPWMHVINTKYDKVTLEYAIMGYPTKIIIDPQGRIFKVFQGESEEFYKTLDTIFGSKKSKEH